MIFLRSDVVAVLAQELERLRRRQALWGLHVQTETRLGSQPDVARARERERVAAAELAAAEARLQQVQASLAPLARMPTREMQRLSRTLYEDAKERAAERSAIASGSGSLWDRPPRRLVRQVRREDGAFAATVRATYSTERWRRIAGAASGWLGGQRPEDGPSESEHAAADAQARAANVGGRRPDDPAGRDPSGARLDAGATLAAAADLEARIDAELEAAGGVGIEDIDDEPCGVCGMDRPYHEAECRARHRDDGEVVAHAAEELLPDDGCDLARDLDDCDDWYRYFETGGPDFHRRPHTRGLDGIG